MKKKQNKATSVWENILEGRISNFLFILIMFLILAVFFFKIAFKDYVPAASDTIQWRASAEQIIKYNESNKDQALWTPAIFSGMPSYLISFANKYPFIDTITKLTNKVMNWRILLLFTMGLGVYLFMIYLKFDPLIALISAIALALSVHFIGLIEIGHNSKFKAVVYIPWIMFMVHYLKERRSILALGLTSLMIIGQLRENHPQISYYTFLMLAVYWIFQLIWAARDREWKHFIVFTLLLATGLLIAALAVAQPYLSTYEYSRYTIRGGSSGLDTSYATSWSFHPLEILSFINPSFFGGVSPHYWGWMPFTQTSMYMGIIILFFALIAILFSKQKLVGFLGTISLISLFISFGRHLPFLSDFLLRFLPGFNKFRVPAMILVLLQFAVVILAGYGLKTILSNRNKPAFQRKMQRILIGVIIIIVISIIALNYLQSSGFVKSGEASRYEASQLQRLKAERQAKAINDGIICGLLLIAAIAITLLFGYQKLGKYPYLILILLLVVIDLLRIDNRFLKDIYPQSYVNRTYAKSDIDKYLEKDEEIFRIYPLGSSFAQNQWGFYNQTIGGYHGAKLKRYQEIIENCLNYEFQNRIPINWNIVNMLNAKYVIYPDNLPLENLEWAFYDRRQKQTVYRNLSYLPRAWFVDETEVISAREEIWKRLNQKEFDPSRMAIVESDIPRTFAPQNAEIQLLNFDLHKLEFDVITDTLSFLTLSEIYYPAGWKAYLDDEEIEIYPTNYILRGMIIPAGEHRLILRFEPEIYAISLKLSLAGLIITMLLLIIGSIIYYKQNYRSEIVYVVKRED